MKSLCAVLMLAAVVLSGCDMPMTPQQALAEKERKIDEETQRQLGWLTILSLKERSLEGELRPQRLMHIESAWLGPNNKMCGTLRPYSGPGRELRFIDLDAKSGQRQFMISGTPQFSEMQWASDCSEHVSDLRGGNALAGMSSP